MTKEENQNLEDDVLKQKSDEKVNANENIQNSENEKNLQEVYDFVFRQLLYFIS